MQSLIFVLAVLLGCSQVWAQRPGGSAGHSSAASPGAGFHSGTRAGSGLPAGTTMSTLSHRNPSPGQLIYPTPIGLQPVFSGYSGINRGALPVNGGHVGNNRVGRGGYGYGYGGGYVLPYYSTFDDYPTPYTYYDSFQDQAAQNANATANMLGEQVQRLTSEVEALRADRSMPAAAGPSTGSGEAPVPFAEDPPDPPLTLVLQNGQKVQLKSYAVTGQDIWDFSKQPAKRIPLASVDVRGSRAATEALGGEFPEIGK